MNDDIAVLMCTFNGEKYIKKQIDTILNQRNANVTLFIRDDGSSDKTVKIIEKYAAFYPEKVIVVKNIGLHLGPGLGFMRLFFYVFTKYNKYSYYAFADQDDIWMKNKLNTGVIQLRNLKTPGLYCSNVYLYKDNRVMGLRTQSIPDLTLEGHIMKNTINGCTFLFNLEMARTLYKGGIPDKRILLLRCHDSWIIMVAILTGKVLYDNEAHMYYRIHSKNDVGVRTHLSLKKRVEKYGSIFPYYGLWRKTAKNLKQRYTTCSEQLEVLNTFYNYNKGLINRLRFFNYICDIYDGNKVELFIKVMCSYV